MPHIEVNNSDLAARCTRCGKHIMYEHCAIGKTRMTLDWWKRLLAAFVKKHRNCKETP